GDSMTPNAAHQSPLTSDHRCPIRPASTTRVRPTTATLVVPFRHLPRTGVSKVSLDGISLSYETNGGEQLLALDNINLIVKAGEFLCIVGPSGCGKSTLLHLIAGLQPATSGKVLIDDQQIEGTGT